MGADRLVVLPHDQVFIRLDAEPAVLREVSDFFTFEVPGARFTPAYKRGGWDGTIKLLKRGGFLYAGLFDKLSGLADSRTWELDDRRDLPEFDPVDAAALFESLGLPARFVPHDYQVDAVAYALQRRRALMLSPTSSGKSLMIYAIARYHERCLVVVPTTNLVKQMLGDFRDYGYQGEQHGVMAGQPRESDAPVVVTTWQSAMRVEDKREWMNQFDCVVVDECHLAKAKSITSLLEAATDVRSRFGFTGTLDGTATSEMVLEGLFGPVRRVTTTRALIDEGRVADARIKVLILRHPERLRRASSGAQYQDEIKYLVGSEARSRFVSRLAAGLRGNTLVLYTRVEQHGARLAEMIREDAAGREVRFVHGGVDADEREEVRALVEASDDAIAVCSYGTFSTGVNMRRINNVVFASPYKSRVLVLQSIGRGLRLAEGKSSCDVYDIADDLSFGNWRNHTLRHAYERVKTYASERLDYKTYQIDLPEPETALAQAINSKN